jgi:hypothetical protein
VSNFNDITEKPFLGNFEEEFNIDTSLEKIHLQNFTTNYTAGKRPIDYSGEKISQKQLNTVKNRQTPLACSLPGPSVLADGLTKCKSANGFILPVKEEKTICKNSWHRRKRSACRETLI